MNWRLILLSLQKSYRNKLSRLYEKVGLENTGNISNSVNMESSRKLMKYIPEQCELIINVNKKGACRFDIVSKIESVCEDQTVYFSAAKDGEDSVNLQSIGVGHEETDISQSVGVKDLGDIATRIPPTWKYVALDCEFVGVQADVSALGRCSIVNYEGDVVCDIYAQPVEKITTYRTRWSGITKKHMKKAIPLESALSQISDIIEGKIVVGHGIHNDFRVMGFSHPEHLIRDTQRSKHLLEKMKQESGTNQVSLKRMTDTLLGRTIQTGAHCSIVDATASMDLYKLVREEWETNLLQKSSSGDDSDQSPGNTDENMATKEENRNQEHSSLVDKVLNLTRTLKGKITKKKNRNKKCNSLKLRRHFGQIIGDKKLTDYFREDKTVLKKGTENLSAVIQNKCPVNFKNGSLDKKRPVSDEVAANDSNKTCVVSTQMTLRDGKTYQNVTNGAVQNGCVHSCTEKYHMKTNYAQTIKHLFNDQFWQDLPVTDKNETDSHIVSVE